MLESQNGNNYPRFICNYYQPGTKEIAGERFCQWIKNPQNIWNKIPFLLFCEDYDVQNVTISQSNSQRIWISQKVEELIVFASSVHPPKKFKHK